MNGFEKLPVCFTNPGGAQSTHIIFCKRHTVRQASEKTPNGLTLFTLGWPPYSRSEMVQDLFSRVGLVSAVYMCDRPGHLEESEQGDASQSGRGGVGYVVFSSADEVDGALKMCNVKEPVVCACNQGSCGLQKWCEEYAKERRSLSSLEALVEQVVKRYELKKKEDKDERTKTGEPDEEGWVTVTRKRALPVGRQEKKKRKKKELLNFYNFQQRETQRQRIAELRKKFEEDKRRVEQMREKRKFKPF